MFFYSYAEAFCYIITPLFIYLVFFIFEKRFDSESDKQSTMRLYQCKLNLLPEQTFLNIIIWKMYKMNHSKINKNTNLIPVLGGRPRLRTKPSKPRNMPAPIFQVHSFILFP